MFRNWGNSPNTPWVDITWNNNQNNFPGMFKGVGSVRMSDASNGTSQSIGVFEDMHWQGPAVTGGPIPFSQYNDTGCWMSGLGAINSGFKPINFENDPAQSSWQGDRRCNSWSSMHPGGANAAMVDGSVRFFSDSLDHVVQYCLINRNDGIAFTMP